MRFGVSTQLYHAQRLCQAHLEEIASYGFDTVELVATRSHLDYHDAAAREAFASWLTAAGLRLHSIHAPITDAIVGRTWGTPFSNASPVEAIRARAVHEALTALTLADLVPVTALVVHVGLPDVLVQDASEHDREAAVRSILEIADAARARGVTVALENIPGRLSTPDAITALLDTAIGRRDVGACLDFGHANLMDGVVDAVESFSDVLVTTHVHDNHGTRDEHLVPGAGTIGWSEALTALRKIGYDGLCMLEVAAQDGPTTAVLDAARQARARLDAIWDQALAADQLT